MARTIGIAVGIPEPWGSQLDERRTAAGDPMADLIPAHLTLLGPTKVGSSDTAWSAIEAHLAATAARHRTFQLQLRGTGTFRPVTQVVFVAVAAGATACDQLAADIRSGPLAQELDYPYHPHVTVAHDIETDALDTIFNELATFEARFPVDAFSLYEKCADRRWHQQRRFQLAR